MADTDTKFTDSPEVIFPTRVSRWIPLSHLPLRISERKVLLRLLDVLMLNSSLLLIGWLRLGMSLSWKTILARPQWFVLLTSLWLLLTPVFDAYSLKKASSLRESIQCVTKSALLTLSIYLLIPYITPYLLPSRLTTGLFVAFTLSFLSFGRALYALTLAQPFFQRKALIIGAGGAGRTIAQVISRTVISDYQLVGYIDDDPAKQGRIIEGIPVLGTHEDLVSLVRALDVDEVILAITHLHEVHDDLFRAILNCQELGFRITHMPELYERITGMVPVEHSGRNLQVLLPPDHAPTTRLYAGLKRLVDILISLVGLTVLGVLLPFIALALYLDSPGPIFYAQHRVGKGRKIFRLFKLRTMIPNAEGKGEAVWAGKGDPRVTRVGRFLRVTHIDELPQFISVLKGEMSVVGPRPERPEFVAELEKRIPFYLLRHSVLPGMAGWALVKQGYGSSVEDALVKVQYDLYYIKHQSVWLDLIVLLKTFGNMLTFRGR